MKIARTKSERKMSKNHLTISAISLGYVLELIPGGIYLFVELANNE